MQLETEPQATTQPVLSVISSKTSQNFQLIKVMVHQNMKGETDTRTARLGIVRHRSRFAILRVECSIANSLMNR